MLRSLRPHFATGLAIAFYVILATPAAASQVQYDLLLGSGGWNPAASFTATLATYGYDSSTGTLIQGTVDVELPFEGFIVFDSEFLENDGVYFDPYAFVRLDLDTLGRWGRSGVTLGIEDGTLVALWADIAINGLYTFPDIHLGGDHFRLHPFMAQISCCDPIMKVSSDITISGPILISQHAVPAPAPLLLVGAGLATGLGTRLLRRKVRS